MNTRALDAERNKDSFLIVLIANLSSFFLLSGDMKTLPITVTLEYSDVTKKWLCHAVAEENGIFSGLALGDSREEALLKAQEQVSEKYRGLRGGVVELQKSILKDEIILH